LRSSDLTALTAIVLADGPGADARVVGLSLAERARRVAVRAGAVAVLVVRSRAELAPWWRTERSTRVLVLRATDQLVHSPLVASLVATHHPLAIAVDPVDGAYGGAMQACGAAASTLVAALAAGEDDRALAARVEVAAHVAHGPIARHPTTTADQRRAAARMLYRIVHKPQDNAVTRWLYRPLSFPLTRLLVHTSVTPNQISYVTAFLVAIGCWITATGSALTGTAIVLAASYVDCCDGEVARLKLATSRYGAWLDTVVDELSQIAYMTALGLHCAHVFSVHYLLGDLGHYDPWHVAIAVGVATYAIAIYCVYWNIVVVVGSANSQDYVGKFEITDGDRPGTARLRPIASQAIATSADVLPSLRWIATYAPYIIRRDFVCWGTLALAALHLPQVGFGLLIVGGVATALVVTIDHVRLRTQLVEIRRRERVLVR